MSPKQRIAWVSGGSRGIGRAIAIALSEDGFRVGLIARTTNDLLATSAKCVGSVACAADLSTAEGAQHAAGHLLYALGPPDVLINNAGDVLRKSVEATSVADWHLMLNANLSSAFYLTQAALPALLAQRGRVINIASIAGREGTPMLSAYCAAKHGVVGLTRAWAKEWGGAIIVNAVCPGSVDTDMLQRGLPGATPSMSPDDVAACVRFLATAPRAMNGACIDIFG